MLSRCQYDINGIAPFLPGYGLLFLPNKHKCENSPTTADDR